MSQLLLWVIGGLAWMLTALLLPAFLGMSPWLAKKVVIHAARRLPQATSSAIRRSGRRR